MPVQIGSSSPNFNDPLRLLSDCHRRVEMFLGGLRLVGERGESPLGDEARRTLETSLRYFRLAAPKHTADEEASLFPRLRQVNSPELQELMRAMEELEGDHRHAEPLHNEVERIGARWLAEGTVPDADLQRFRRVVAELMEMYARHIRFEDEVLFPAAERLLPPEQREAVGREMAGRREVDVEAQARLLTQLSK